MIILKFIINIHNYQLLLLLLLLLLSIVYIYNLLFMLKY